MADASPHLEPSTDPWLRALAAARTDGGDGPLPGRLLRAKIGYNPNSSSVGSVVTVLVWSATTATVVFSLLQARIAAAGNVPTHGAANDDEHEGP